MFLSIVFLIFGFVALKSTKETSKRVSFTITVKGGFKYEKGINKKTEEKRYEVLTKIRKIINVTCSMSSNLRFAYGYWLRVVSIHYAGW